ncbi:efflux RND transporter periplasmic adaptor subunit [Horticoccus luteus]|uniref:Efflux RND transporter periplasmic adaptor subunit n=1 Tax=Horticoccus luteus TaxID=2862869 RepID=A0A8F9TWP0_9BACT|nr:efflux RND transporter periplasmic adaptor subunit [Horticoccus luteus]QYM78932.1 efflux RND transporter periplasmic adaptor subunit [Horticoccus luteus]
MKSLCLTLLFAAGAAIVSAAPKAFDAVILPYKEVVVSSPVQSSITAIFVKEGDVVTLGQPLAQLYNKMEELDMNRTKAALEKKEFDFKGSKNLYADKIISEDEALKNRIELELAKLQFDMASEVHHQREIVAPIAGIVVEKLREVGEAVQASQPMFRLVDISRVYVQFYVRAEDLAALKVGDEMDVRCPVVDPTGTFVGKVDFIDPRVDAASGLMRVKVILPNADGRIKAGLRAEVSRHAE